ncbi:MAG: hypothetical protein ACR2IV_07555 [Bryobacteraceae bacterium]
MIFLCADRKPREAGQASPNTVHLMVWDPLGKVEVASALTFAWTQIVVAHFSFHAARIDPIPARNDAFLKNLIEDRFMQGFLLLRGE